MRLPEISCSGPSGWCDTNEAAPGSRLQESLERTDKIINREDIKVHQKISKKRFVRYKEGAELYSMCQRKFEQMAKDANAVYKLDKLVLVNCDIFEEYLETFRVKE